ncbi:hypothetical protein AAG570_012309 [Ranatra chinensis]|uniref:G-protein coupled receptors family 1 profile domain-containing protein n=1 Tax=Ranatra chinensis TaxID=642074 RepID=A0ABD0YIK3_9HEMI
MDEEDLANSTVGWQVLNGFQLYYVPVLVVLGTLGNCLSVLVFFATKLRKLSSSYYLSALAVSDTGFLLGLFLSWLNLVDVTLFTQQGFCQFSVYFSQVCSFLSVWFIVAFTVERFIAVRYPLKRPSMCTVSRAKSVLAVLSLLALLIHSPYFVISAPQLKLNDTMIVCGLVPEWMSLASVLNHVDFLITLVVPFCLIVVLNTLISRTVWRVSRLRRSMTQSGKRRPNQPSSSTSQTKVTQMLLVVSSVFICLNLPSYVIRVWVYLNEVSCSF